MTDAFSHDCLYLTLNKTSNLDEKVSRVQQIVEFCIRSSTKVEDNVIEKPVPPVLTFDQLKKANVTAENLIQWSSPMDVIERYQNFLQKNKSSSIELFYNCTAPWFGPFCQYKFALNQSFVDIVDTTFGSKKKPNDNATFTCYVHMKCNRGSSLICLDWREICDGKIDCLEGGEDEKYCLELGMNQCGENEYQCRNGMCVNDAFLSDELIDVNSPDCLDGSDEPRLSDHSSCAFSIGFRCDDVICRFPFDFTCGNGECFSSNIPIASNRCKNNRDQIFNYLIGWHNAEDTRFPRCFKTLICASDIFNMDRFNNYCKSLCENKQECKTQSLQLCPSEFITPTFPVWNGHVRLGYFSNQTFTKQSGATAHFVCYNKHRCTFLVPTLIVDQYTCLHIHALNLSRMNDFYTIFTSCSHLYQSTNETHCVQPTMLRCLGTNKCIHKRHIMDGIPDCYNGFDESLAANSCALNDKYRFECTSEKKCLAPLIVGDRKKQCADGEDEPYYDGLITNIQQLPFSALCDNWIDMFSSTNDTDETHCEQWPCVNQYTRCNKAWNCPKGIDEINCPSSFQCPVNHHPCLFPNNHTMGCLHLNNSEDGIVDCLGATDERSYCRLQYPMNLFHRYRCWNDTICVQVSDRCRRFKNLDNIDQLCEQSYDEIRDIILYLTSTIDIEFYVKLPFSHKSSRSFLPIQYQSSANKHVQHKITEIAQININKKIDDRHVWLCNRGIVILVGQDEMEQCLCPPNYYGDRCQYQNQRVSLTIRLRKENFTKLDVIGIIITLVDHTDLVHSHEQVTYIPIFDCNTKFNIYLLYQDRPKDMTKNYTIHIDAYDKVKLIYLTSWILPVTFLFMPVNRVSAQLTIPAQRDCRLLCSHKYQVSLRNVDSNSCQRNSNRSGIVSSIQDECNCSPDSICVGFVKNRSICLCPSEKMGPRCFLDSICQVNMCMNGGLCVPDDVRISLNNSICVCPEGFSGHRCETKDVKIDISFSGVEIPQHLLVHFITALDYSILSTNPTPIRATRFKKIPFDQTTVTFDMSLSFHLMFAQLEDIYYLIVLQHNYTPSTVIATQITPSQRCPHIRELFDELTVGFSILHRVKYYNVPCEKHSDLACFHDNDTFICLCTAEERHANCFHFDFNMTYNCRGLNDCENGARCFQDHPQCPTKRTCVCPECFYGGKCQLSSKHSGLSLDSILGYHIYPDLSIAQQSASVKISIALATLMLVIGLIGGTLSNLTFQSKSLRKVGCGLYLHASSITSILTISCFYLKLWLLILSQMNIITLRSLLWINCISIEFILRSLLAINDWFQASVAVERALAAVLGVNFDKAKSKKAARPIILAITLLTVVSILHDPIHRRLMDDVEDRRTWCLVRFMPNVEIYNRFINLFHFIIPFSLNLLSTIIVIVVTARQRLSIKKQCTFKEQLKEQFFRHKHLILSSILLVILALPRLTISFLPNCMTSSRDFKLFLAAYFISFMPPLLTFFVFVLTSKTYKDEFDVVIIRKWKAFRIRMHLE